MVVDITYRVQSRNQLKRLRVRFRQPDGTSSIAVLPDPEALRLAATAAGLNDELKTAIAEDVNVASQSDEHVHYRRKVDIPANAPQLMGGSDWQPPREFTLSFTRNEIREFLLYAKEWNSPVGEMSTHIRERMPAPEIQERLASIGLTLADVRDRDLPGHLGSRRVDGGRNRTAIPAPESGRKGRRA
jgi:hypothetical protein